MTCKPDGTHFACDCILKQLQAADELAKALDEDIEKIQGCGCCAVVTDARIKDVLAAYEKARGLK